MSHSRAIFVLFLISETIPVLYPGTVTFIVFRIFLLSIVFLSFEIINEKLHRSLGRILSARIVTPALL